MRCALWRQWRGTLEGAFEALPALEWGEGGGACQVPVLVPLCWGGQWHGSYDLLPACEDLTPGFICRVPPKGRWSLAGPGPRTAQLGLQKARRALAQTLSGYEWVRVGSLAHSPFSLPRPNQQV